MTGTRIPNTNTSLLKTTGAASERKSENGDAQDQYNRDDQLQRRTMVIQGVEHRHFSGQKNLPT